jgi:hypothetical protein
MSKKTTRNKRWQTIQRIDSDVLTRPTAPESEIMLAIAYLDAMEDISKDGLWRSWFPRNKGVAKGVRRLDPHFCVENPREIDARSKKERRLTYCDTCVAYEAGK